MAEVGHCLIIFIFRYILFKIFPCLRFLYPGCQRLFVCGFRRNSLWYPEYHFWYSIDFNNSWLNVCFRRQLRQRMDNCGKKKFDVKPLRRFPSLNYFALLADRWNDVFVILAFTVIKKRNVIRALKSQLKRAQSYQSFFPVKWIWWPLLVFFDYLKVRSKFLKKNQNL